MRKKNINENIEKKNMKTKQHRRQRWHGSSSVSSGEQHSTTILWRILMVCRQ